MMSPWQQLRSFEGTLLENIEILILESPPFDERKHFRNPAIEIPNDMAIDVGLLWQ